jgi:hypothetical protein
MKNTLTNNPSKQNRASKEERSSRAPTGSANGSGARARSGAGGGAEPGCKCIAETETQLREKLDGDLAKMKPAKDAKMKSLMPKNGAILWSTGRWILSIPFEATWTLPNGKQKETTVNMIASHCPFCGRPVGEKP